ncbi:MAG: S9 family peptidase [Hyphomonadaceae bacterium]|nr:S9 family peptidase [Hyphomonadaceae bacterium]
MRWTKAWLLLIACLLFGPFAAHAQDALLTRDQLGAPQQTSGAISPNGAWLAYIGLEQGVPNIFLAPRAAPSRGEAVTHDRQRGIRDFRFAYDNRHLLFTQDNNGDENDRLYALNLRTRAVRALTPAGSRAIIDTLRPHASRAVLVMLNDRNPEYFDPVRIDISSGRTERLFENSEYAAFVADTHLNLRLATRYTDDGAKHWFQYRDHQWRPWSDARPEDALTTTILGFASDDRTMYLADSRGRDTAAIFAIDMRTGGATLVAADDHVDLTRIVTHPRSGRAQAIVRNDLRSDWIVTERSREADFAALREIAHNEPFAVTSQTLDDRTWIVEVAPTNASPRTYIYDRSTGRAQVWFQSNPEWASLPLQPLHASELRSRDGLRLTAYYMLPPGADPDGDGMPASPLPTIIWVHGGPWDRESFAFRTLFQLYANRGYAVVSVNFRGSTGFGKAFLNAANGEWGARMQNDLIDAKNWAIGRGLSRGDRIAIVGGSYGGYAALSAMSMTPGEFTCGISVAGPSSLITLMSTIPEYWTSTRVIYETRVGDPDTSEGRTLLQARSPINFASQIRGALLIGQGANDPRVTTTEAEQMVAAMRARGQPVTYVLFPDEGHGFQREENDRAFSAVTEEFLASCLGGRFEPVGDDFQGSSITIPYGAQYLPGVAAALPDRSN